MADTEMALSTGRVRSRGIQEVAVGARHAGLDLEHRFAHRGERVGAIEDAHRDARDGEVWVRRGVQQLVAADRGVQREDPERAARTVLDEVGEQKIVSKAEVVTRAGLNEVKPAAAS